MVNYAGRSPSMSLSEQASIVWWRAVIAVTQWLNRFLGWAMPIVGPVKPYWWIPVFVGLCGFVFGLGAALLLA